MTDTKHTPLPWGIYGSTDGKQIFLKELGNTGPGIIAKVTNFADADLIQRAVNAHYVLVEALEHALEYFKKNGKPIEFNKMIEEVRAALWMARGEA